MELEYRQFSSNIIKYTNESPLPWEFKRLALKDILSQVEAETNKVLTEEIRYREEAQREENKKKKRKER